MLPSIFYTVDRRTKEINKYSTSTINTYSSYKGNAIWLLLLFLMEFFLPALHYGDKNLPIHQPQCLSKNVFKRFHLCVPWRFLNTCYKPTWEVHTVSLWNKLFTFGSLAKFSILKFLWFARIFVRSGLFQTLCPVELNWPNLVLNDPVDLGFV